MVSRGFRGSSAAAQVVGTPRGTQGVPGARSGSGPSGAPRGLGRMCGGLSFKRVASQRRRFPRGSAPGRVRISACGRAGGSRPPSVACAEAPGFPRPADLGDGEEMRPSGWRAGCPSPSGSGESRRAAGSRRPCAVAGGAVWLLGLGGLFVCSLSATCRHPLEDYRRWAKQREMRVIGGRGQLP